MKYTIYNYQKETFALIVSANKQGKRAFSQKKQRCVESLQHCRESEPFMTAGGRMTEAVSEHPTRGYTKECNDGIAP